MNFTVFQQNLQSSLGNNLPALAGAVAILILGWILALMARAGTRHLLRAIKLDKRLSESTHQAIELESILQAVIFWLVIAITLVAVLNVLHLEILSGPFAILVTQIIGYLPHLLGGLILMLFAYVLASLVRFGAKKTLQSTSLDDKLVREAGMVGASKNAADVLFWLIILLFVPMILSALDLNGMLTPIQGMTEKILLMLPNIFAAGVLAFVGWLVASIVRSLVTNLLQAVGADNWSEKAGMTERIPISQLAGMLCFILIFVPMLIAALDALKIETISKPATHMLDQILSAIPHILAAALILLITWYVARFAASLLEKLLFNLGIDSLPAKLGCAEIFSGNFQPSRLVGGLVLFFAMLFATVEASNRLGFTQVSTLVAMFTIFGGKVLLGVGIFIVGYWLAGIAYQVVARTNGEQSLIWARLTRFAILGLVLAMGLQAMEVAEHIVNLAFGLTLGAIAVAFALAFGLGGRDAAARIMDYWSEKFKR